MEKETNIFLIGFMGCGKSTIAAELRRMFGMQVIEMDQLISERQKMSISEIFHQYGEVYFRDLETALLREIQSQNAQVISCGGGVVLREENVSMMKQSGKVVLLTASPETILQRVSQDEDRPILKGKKNIEDIAALMETRREKYETAADIVVHTDGKSVQEISKEIMEKVEGETLC